MAEEKIRYLTQAHHQIRRLMVDEEKGLKEYEDLASMLELAGSKLILGKIRRIISEEEQHKQELKGCAEFLRQAINRMERVKVPLNMKDKIYKTMIGHYGGYYVMVPAENFAEFKQAFPARELPRDIRRTDVSVKYTPQGAQRFNTKFPNSNGILFEVHFAHGSKGLKTLEHVLGPHPWPE